jgi:hypothetical protein
MFIRYASCALPALALASACARSGGASARTTPIPVDVAAELRVVRGESTWVARGPGYELIARSRRDLGFVEPAVDREIASFRRVFPTDTTTVVATVRPALIAGQAWVAPPLLPETYRGAVDLVLPSAKSPLNGREAGPTRAQLDVTELMARVWLSAHASRITGVAAGPGQRVGEAEDPRVPGWAAEMIPTLGMDSVFQRSMGLAMTHTEELIPLTRYFAMALPSSTTPVVAGRGGNRGGAPGGGGGGMGGGGRRGGMGGGGRGGMRGGGSERSGGREEAAVPARVLFAVESVVLGKYLSRDGYDFIASLVDGEIAGKSVDDLVATHNLKSVADLESQWRLWIAAQAEAAARH